MKTPTPPAPTSAAPSTPPRPRLWRAGDVAVYLAASESFVRHAAAEGRLPRARGTPFLRFVENEIRAWAERGEWPVNHPPLTRKAG